MLVSFRHFNGWKIAQFNCVDIHLNCLFFKGFNELLMPLLDLDTETNQDNHHHEITENHKISEVLFAQLHIFSNGKGQPNVILSAN